MKDPGSFRDPSGFVVLENDKVLRVINNSYKENYKKTLESGLYQKLLDEKFIVDQKEISGKTYAETQYKLLEAEKIDTITYPYEWSFSQFKDAALLTLKIQKIAVKHGMKLKDATPFNVQFHNNKPIFIDTLSFEKIENENFSWNAYRQFCEMFFGPICLMKFIDPRINKNLISFINGIPLDLLCKQLTFFQKLNPSIFIHLVLHSWISNRKNQNKEGAKEKIISKSQHLNIVSQLESFITSLEILDKKSEWGDYNEETVSEKEGYVIDKQKTVNKLLGEQDFQLAWDVGSNDGFYSRIIGKNYAQKVISMDIDWKCVEKNYLTNKEKEIDNVFPMIFDLSNPSPSIGWMNKERSAIFSRIGNPDLITCFAIMHHIINANIPIELFVEFIGKSSSHVLIEYIPLIDPKCEEIFSSRGDDFNYPDKNYFESLISIEFNILFEKTLNETERVLYYLKKK